MYSCMCLHEKNWNVHIDNQLAKVKKTMIPAKTEPAVAQRL